VAKPIAKDRPRIIIIKKKGGHAAHHGGAWKVAYADFVTAMMAFFMVLWLVSQTDEVTRSELAHYFRSGVFSGSGHVIGDAVPSGHGPTVGGGTPQMREQGSLEQAATSMQRALDLAVLDDPQLQALREQIDVSVVDEGLLIQISEGGEDLLFGLSSAELSAPLRTFLDTLGPVLGSIPNHLQIHGHTDARPFPAGATFDNWDLSFRRGDEAREYLEQHGVAHGQIVAVVAHADSDLLYPDEPLDPRNRRLSILAVRRGSEHVTAHGVPPIEGDHLPAPIGAHAETEPPQSDGSPDAAVDAAHDGDTNP